MAEETNSEPLNDKMTDIGNVVCIVLAVTCVLLAALRVILLREKPELAFEQTTLNYLVAAAVFIAWPSISKFKGFGVELEKIRQVVKKAEVVAKNAEVAANNAGQAANSAGQAVKKAEVVANNAEVAANNAEVVANEVNEKAKVIVTTSQEAVEVAQQAREQALVVTQEVVASAMSTTANNNSSPTIIVPSIHKTASTVPIAERQASAAQNEPSHDPDDPHFGKFGGQREADGRRASVGPITPLHRLSQFYTVPLLVEPLPGAKPIEGTVRFHLHPSFGEHALKDVEAKDGVATLNIVSYGAFAVGIETDFQGKDASGKPIEPATRLELRLWDADIKAPDEFKNS